MKHEYQLKGNFVLLDYFISHKQVLYRAEVERNDGKFNIDVLFEGVSYINMPTYFKDMEIKIATEIEKVNLQDMVGAEIRELYKVGIEGINYYISCNFIKVEENNLPPLKSSILKWEF